MPGKVYVVSNRQTRFKGAGGSYHATLMKKREADPSSEPATKQELEKTIKNKPAMDKLMMKMEKMKIKKAPTQQKSANRHRISLDF